MSPASRAARLVAREERGPAAPPRDARADARSDPTLAAALEGWRIEGRARVAAHWREFQDLLSVVEPLIEAGRHGDAAAAAQVAANHAVLWHPGIFASGELERLLRRLGAAALSAPRPAPLPDTGRGRLRVLHVASQVGAIGGHSRMIRRWIARDGENTHSLALTRQIEPVPAPLAETVARAGGGLHRVNRRLGGLIAWARELQTHLGDADLVVLHVHNMDVVPFLALGGLERSPPTILLNHGDHLFWIGAESADVVASSRRSGHALSATRRGIAPERNLLLPLCLEAAPERQLSRSEAKRRLGLPDDATVILSVARALKFRPIAGASFADAFVPVLREHPRAHLVAVGPGGTENWSAAMSAVPGRIHAFAERPDTATFLEAADVYVDSFPFASITSLSEAGLAGLPLLTHHAFGPAAAVAGADSLGLDDVLLRTETLADFRDQLRRLLADADLREAVGRRTRAHIEAVNMGPGWADDLASVYGRVLDLPRRRDAPASSRLGPSLHFDDIDVFAPFLFGTAGQGATAADRRALSTEFVLKIAPMRWRLRHLAGLAWRRQLRTRSPLRIWRYLVPEWLTCRWRSRRPGGA
ncbi:glycosyltransferase [Antarcticirhabdus aurantiaca]|uniref:Glycosyltransferase n=1 Tax=Antarcticirhabdus aurantiaca TaxID=2606717 RepID=A0ACD4NM66_9HYPH|nr:glycosyltransferase [Antarcticirhabdus aurantiaca]WAJ27957.1 glycosyltransferase [Jeongeuplla avenae]